VPSPQVKRPSNKPQSRSTTPLGTIKNLKQLARNASASMDRFEIYKYLEAVYRVYVGWKDHSVAKRASRALARKMSIKRRSGRSSLRILIEATLPEANHKQKSRWVRALEYVYSERISAKKFHAFVRRHAGLAGCARLAASACPKWSRSPLECREAPWDD
jgi:hypothetical protein